jgi:hypothetical protein
MFIATASLKKRTRSVGPALHNVAVDVRGSWNVRSRQTRGCQLEWWHASVESKMSKLQNGAKPPPSRTCAPTHEFVNFSVTPLGNSRRKGLKVSYNHAKPAFRSEPPATASL